MAREMMVKFAETLLGFKMDHYQLEHRLQFPRWPIFPQVLDSTSAENRRRWR